MEAMPILEVLDVVLVASGGIPTSVGTRVDCGEHASSVQTWHCTLTYPVQKWPWAPLASSTSGNDHHYLLAMLIDAMVLGVVGGGGVVKKPQGPNPHWGLVEASHHHGKNYLLGLPS